MTRFFGNLYPAFMFFIIMFVLLSVFRSILIIWKYNEITDTSVLNVIIKGFRFDTILLSMIVMIFFLIFPVIKLTGIKIEYFWGFSGIYFTVFACFIIFMELSTFSFISEYGMRPNRLFIEYLIYPKEVFTMLIKEFKLQLFISFIVMFFTFKYGYRFFSQNIGTEWSRMDFLIKYPIFFIILFIGARSTFGHRAVNISSMIQSSNSTVNDIGLNSAYTILYSLYRMKDEGNSSEVYGNMQKEEMLDIVMKNSGISKDRFVSEEVPTLHFQKNKSKRGKPYNLVIILEESMGAGFVHSLGGQNFTPELEKLSKEGIWFENLYATGTRTVRGIEAVLSGFLPTPGRSVVKLGLSQNNFFTLGSFLKKYDYSTQFIYGGQSSFDNMASFFSGNGFDSIIDESKFVDPEFHGTWGVSDEDLFNRLDEELKEVRDESFFKFVLTTSNHLPFEFPDGKIEFEGKKNTLENAVRYADYSLGRFFEKAKKQKYYENTVFLVVADHELRVSGGSLVPVEKFKIPGLIIAPDIKPSVYKNIVSQIDLPVTLLSMIGVEGIHPMIGRDLINESWNDGGRAIMQYGNNQAYLTEDYKVVLVPEKEPEISFNNDGQWIKVKESVENYNIMNKALAHALLPSYLYKNQLYSLIKEID